MLHVVDMTQQRSRRCLSRVQYWKGQYETGPRRWTFVSSAYVPDTTDISQVESVESSLLSGIHSLCIGAV
jgi:hypothetical protein